MHYTDGVPRPVYFVPSSASEGTAVYIVNADAPAAQEDATTAYLAHPDTPGAAAVYLVQARSDATWAVLMVPPPKVAA